ncbi:MAG TPA: LysM peptidoglycan-binding domain-containing protein [Candidatus Bathyarchaeia archaeon]|nr:LysM peptidoglycan-binding domain-containing protein [Candidatus Bathyarchaeia archaeon]
MRSSRTERKAEHRVPEELHGQSQMLSRKLRHSKQKRISYNSLIKLGLVVFGALFIGLFLLEMVKSQNVPEANVNVIENHSTAMPAVKPLVTHEKQDPQLSTAAETKAPETKTSPVKSEQPATEGQGTPKSKPGQEQPAESKASQPAETKAKQPAAVSPTASAQTSQPAANHTVKPAADAQVEVVRHVVKQGDTLFKLSRQYYGNSRGVDSIARYNGLTKDDQLLTGTVLSIPVPKK